MKEDQKLNLKQKKQASARDFIKMKRMKMNEEKSNASSFTKIKQLIIDEVFEEFNQNILKLTPDVMLSFLFSQNQFRVTAFNDVIRAKNIRFLQTVTTWSIKHQDFIIKQIESGVNELKEKDWSNRFSVLNKFIVDFFTNTENHNQQNRQKLLLLGSAGSLYHILAKYYLNLETLTVSVNCSKPTLEVLQKVYCFLFQNSDMKSMKELASSIKSYYQLLKADKMWSMVHQPNFLKQLKQSQIELLQLSELGYNLWHEYAGKNSKMFLQTCCYIEEEAESEICSKLVQLLLKFDNSGQLPLDICLRKWDYKDLSMLFNNYKGIDNLALSTSCLNHILTNKLLSQKEKETMINECLHGSIGQKGYIQAIRQSKLVNKGKITQISTNLYEAVTRFDKNSVKIQKDTDGNYPLLSYFKLYKEKSNLEFIDKLWLAAFDKKNLKKKYLLFYCILTSSQFTFEPQSDYHKQIDLIFEYYQPLWKQLTFLSHGDVFEHFVNKCYLNVFQIQYLHSNVVGKSTVCFFGPHFINFYIENSKNLQKNVINQNILAQILDCKQREKDINNFQLIQQLMISFSRLDIVQKQKTFVVQKLCSSLNNHFQVVVCREDLQKQNPMFSDYPLVYHICKYLIERKNKSVPFFDLKEVAHKIGIQRMKQFIKVKQQNFPLFDWKLPRKIAIQRMNQFYKVKQKLDQMKNLYKQILKTLGEKYQQDKMEQSAKQNDPLNNKVSSNILQLQKQYSDFYSPKNLNRKFFQQKLPAFLEKNIQNLYFRLHTAEHFLDQKIIMLCARSFDVYFSKHSHSAPALQAVKDQKMKILMNKMYAQNCSFIEVLSTSTDNNITVLQRILAQFGKKFNNLKYTFFQNLLCPNYSVRRKIIEFISPSKDIYNLQFIIDSVQLVNKYFAQVPQVPQGEISQTKTFNLIDTLKLFFHENIRQLLQKIQVLDSQLKINIKQKEKITRAINQQKKNLQNYFQEWYAKISQICKGDKQILDEIVLQLLDLCEKKNMLDYSNKFIDCIDLKVHLNSQIMIRKISITPHIEEKYLQLLEDIDEENFLSWLDIMTCSTNNSLMKSISKFSAKHLTKMIQKLINRYEYFNIKVLEKQQLKKDQHYVDGQNKDQLSEDILKSIIKVILKIHRMTPEDHKLQNIIKIQHSSQLNKKMTNQYRHMIMSTTHWGNTTAAFIILPPQQFVFYMKQNGKVTSYTTYNFYKKSSEQHFDTYLNNLKKLYTYCPNLAQHLQITTSVLIETQNWSRLFKVLNIESIQKQLVNMLFSKLYKTTNREAIKKDPIFQKIIQHLFQFYVKYKIEWAEHIFEAAFYFDYKKTLKIFNLAQLKLETIRNCINEHPQASDLLLKSKISLKQQQSLNDQTLKNLFPIKSHYVHDQGKVSWLNYQLRLQNVILASINKQQLLEKTNKCWLTNLSMIPYKQQLYQVSQYPKNVCRAILSNNSITSLQPYVKIVKEIDPVMKQQLQGSSVGRKKNLRCINLQNINPKFIEELIKLKYFSIEQPKVLHSIFLRLLETANLELLNLFVSSYSITINFKFLKEIENLFGFTFWEHLLSISNQNFIIEVIKKFNLFEIYPVQEYSAPLLVSICRNRANILLLFTIGYMETKFKVKPTFAAAIENDSPKITKAGVFYMPVDDAIDFNYYECYFLIKSCQNECPKFRISSRFISKQDPQKWNFISEMKRRVEINNSMIETLRQAQTLEFRNNILLPMIFEHEIKEQKFNNTKSYLGSFLKLLKNIIDKRGDYSDAGIFQKLSMLILNKKKTKIPEEQIEKKYPSEMDLIKKLQKYMNEIVMDCPLEDIIQSCPQFKPLLLLYNPQEFFASPKLVSDLVGDRKQLVTDYVDYLTGIQVNLQYIAQKHVKILEKYILSNFFKVGSSIFDPVGSLHLKRQGLLMILLNIWYHDRKWQEARIYSLIQNQQKQESEKEIFLFFMAKQLNSRGDKASFDLMLWNKILTELENIENLQKKLNVKVFTQQSFNETMLQTLVEKYGVLLNNKIKAQNLNYNQQDIKNTFRQLYHEQKKYRKEGIYVELTFLMNVCYLLNELTVLHNQVKQLIGDSENYKLLSPSTILNAKLAEIKFNRFTHLNNTLVLISFDSQQILEKIHTDTYFMKLQLSNTLPKLDQFFQSADRHQFFKHYKTKVDVSSFRGLRNIALLQKMFEFGPFQTAGVIGRAIQDVQKIEEKLLSNRNIKLYNLSDVYGPVNFNEDHPQKIFDCLGFYELLEFSKKKPIEIIYSQKLPSKQLINEKNLQHFKTYLKYYVKYSKDDEGQPSDQKTQNQILVYIRQDKNKQAKIQISWVGFAAWSVAELVATLLNYCGVISAKIEKVLDVRLSYSSIIDYYSYKFKYNQSQSLKQCVEELLYANNFTNLVESLMLMISEDLRNIMKLVKGIIIKFGINTDKSKVRVKLLQDCYASQIDYEVKDSLLYITLHIEFDKTVQENQVQEYSKLVSRKKFLDCIFQSSQFLTDYFLVRRTLDNLCLQLSTETSKKLNIVINFHIEYSNLYIFVQELRNRASIKQIEGYLKNLKHYLQANLDKCINQYLSSPSLANKHQISLLNKCEALHRDLSLKQIEQTKELVYESLQAENKSGLTQISKLMADIGHDENIKNAFLIQIYKSYYSSVVAQGMTFVVGYQSNKKKAQVISIKKPENVNEINVVQLEFILVVSKTIPTNDELNNSKIIQIFVTDSNWILYRTSQKINKYLLSLPSDHEQRNIAQFAPIIPPNLKLVFTSQDAKQEDTKDTKIFYLDLGLIDKFGQQKFKVKPLEDNPPTNIQNLKKSVEFKESISKFKTGLRTFTKNNISIVIEPPAEINEWTVNGHFDHIVNLVVTDILEMLSRFEYQPMRNQDLDCKLSVEKKIPINQNSIVELRKRRFLKHYRRFRIRISDKDSKVEFLGSEIIINISYLNLKILPSAVQYLSSIVQDLLKKQRQALPKTVKLQAKLQNQSSDVLLKVLDLFNIINYQIQEIDLATKLLQLQFKKQIARYELLFGNKKAGISFEEGLKLTFNLQSVQREFYSAEQILNEFTSKLNPHQHQNEDSFAYYHPLNNQIQVLQSNQTNYRMLAFIDNTWKQYTIRHQIKVDNKVVLQLLFKPWLDTKFFLIDSQNKISSNYFFTVNEGNDVIKTKNYEGVICRPNQLYLQSFKKINFNTTALSITKKDFYKENSTNFNVRRPQLTNILEIFLVSNNIFKFIIKSDQSANLTVHHSAHPNFLNRLIETTSIIITSDGEMSLDHTKFVLLQPFKKKPVLLKDKENVLTNSDFREPNEQASKELFQIKPQDAKNIQNLVYVINDESKRYLTRAGEPRIDTIQFCDANGNPISYQKDFQVIFLHINKLALIRPQIIRQGVDVGLKWLPTVRGHYDIYINNIRINPPYEIGVCAAQADCGNTKVVAPKINKICFCEESEIMLDLKDSFGNIYSQLEEEILGDELLIEFEANKLASYLKINKSQINKYGLKKVKFHFNQTDGCQNIEVDLKVSLNLQLVLQFSFIIQGYSLEQRKKLLDKDIASKDKKYYKELVVNRNKFLQDLITHAQKSLHTSLSIRFVNEPGIDAGGVKREFYDMIGNEMKNEKNPFFIEVNKSRMEYFLNPELLKNKKKLEYMQLWGKYLANSILNGYLIGMSFSPVFVQLLYGQTLTYEDLLEVIPEDQKRQYIYLLTASPEEFQDLGLYFTVVLDKKKAVQFELKEGGKSIPVTADNVKEYLQLMTAQLLNNRYKQLIEAFKTGFQTVLELQIITKWIRPSQFWCLTSGTKQLTPQIVLESIIFQGPGNLQSIIGWFRRYINQAPVDILTGFLKFSTGSSSIDFSRTSKITVSFEAAGDNPKKLPISHTCWKEIVVPKYKNFQIMKKLLNAAFIYCSEGFGFG